MTSSVSGNSIASALLGTGSGGSLPLNVSPAVTQNYYAWFFQDSWRVNKRLTLNLGLRYELQRPRSERFDRGNYFDFEVSNPLGQRVGLPLKGGLVFITPEDRYANRSSYTDLAPRFGFAYKVTDRLVLRGGYGIMFGRTYNLTFPLGVDGYSTSTSWVYSVGNAGILPQDRVSNPYPNGLVQPSGSADGLQTLVGNAVNALPRPNPSPYIQNYSFDVQHQIGANAMFEIGYSGNIGKRLIYGDTRDANQLNPSLLALGSELDRQVANPFFGVIPSGPLASRTIPRQRLLRARPQFSEVLIVNNEKGAYSRFDSLFTRFQFRLGRDLTLISSYQFSRMLDNASSNGGPEGGGTSLRNYFDPAIEYGTSGLDVPHSFVTQGIYHLPVGRDKALGSTWPRLLDTAFGGWQLSAVFRLSSGLPLDMTAQNTLSPYGFHVLRPNYKNLSDLEIDNPTPDRWFNTAAVIQPSQYSIGTGPRFLSNIRQSGPKHVHQGVFKNFQITEQIKAQFRAEMFNLTNTPRFAAPNANLGSTTFGQVTATAFSTPRQVQLGLKLTF